MFYRIGEAFTDLDFARAVEAAISIERLAADTNDRLRRLHTTLFGLHYHRSHVTIISTTGELMMYRDELKNLLERRPFESIAISTHDGAVRYIRHPECAALGASVLLLIEPATDRSERIAYASISSIATFEGQAV